MGEMTVEAFWLHRSRRSVRALSMALNKLKLDSGTYLGPDFLLVTMVAGCSPAFLFFPAGLGGVVAWEADGV